MSADPSTDQPVVATVSVPNGSYRIVLPHHATDYIQQKILSTGEPYEAEMVEAMAARITAADLVLDVGANVGNHTTYLAAVTGCRVVSYEPNPELSAAIAASAEANGNADRVRVRAVGVGSEPGRASFAEERQDNLGAQRLELIDGGGDFEVVRLDDETFDAPVVAMKVDVEGMELSVLAGAEALVGRDHPMIWIECQDLTSFDEVSGWMLEHGYSYRETFNATPTHLFVWVGDSEPLETRHTLVRLVRSVYDLREQVGDARAAKDLAMLRARQWSSHGSGQAAPSTLPAAGAPGSAAGTDADLERERRNARHAYERVRSEALRFRDERDTALERIGWLRQRARARQETLERVRGRRDNLRTRLRALEASPGVRAEVQVRRVVRFPVRVLRAVLRRLRPAPAVPAAPPRQPAPLAEVTTFGAWRGADPGALAAAAAGAQAAGARLRASDVRPGNLRVAAIVDDFTRHSLDPECILLNLTPADWQRELESFRPQLLFVESAWRGQGGSWHNTVPRLPEELRGIFAWCRENGVPTVFWNKEDPIHFERFLQVAAEADFVFTTDVDKLGDYLVRLGHDRVRLLPFACQPRLHNPVEIGERRDALAFAGAYYPRFVDRMRDLRSLVAGASAVMPVEIYDRNYGTVEDQHRFPPEYHPYIVGTLGADEVEIAYKGYRYGLNLNSVKSSQSMFARRVYELLASNTVTVSNYSRAIRLLFGDLVPMSDSEEVMRDLLARMVEDPDRTDRLRALGVRKVLREHTYAHRLDYVVATVTGRDFAPAMPAVTVVVEGDELGTVRRRTEQARAQVDVRVSVTVVTAAADVTAWASAEGLGVVARERLAELRLSELAAPGAEGVAVFHALDWYGEHYLRDLADAWTYTDADAVGKEHAGSSYVAVSGLELRSALLRTGSAEHLPAAVVASEEPLPASVTQFAIHRFDYCQDGAADEAASRSAADSGLPIDQGLDLDEVYARAASLRVDPALDDAPVLGPEAVELVVPAKLEDRLRVITNPERMVIASELEAGEVAQVFGKRRLDIAQVWPDGVARLGFRTEGDLNAVVVVRFFSASGERLGAAARKAGANHEVPVPEGAVRAAIGWRVRGPGRVTVWPLHLSTWPFNPAVELARGEVLLVTNHYPSYQDLYRNGFVHARVRRYQQEGLSVDVFRHREGEALSHAEFEGVDVSTGDSGLLEALVSGGRYRTVVVHFLDEKLWSVLREAGPDVRVLVWVHGAEIQPWWRRAFNYTDDEALDAAKEVSERRVAFWRDVFDTAGPQVHFVFVSQYFAEEVQTDLERKLAADRYSVLHNPIDTDIFRYREKDPEQRHRILSVRPYASRIYANDLAVAAVLELADEPWFDQLSFRFVGDGPLFEETLAPLEGLANVTVERGYLTHARIAELHAEHGVMLIPSRSDTHGVSRDEAMASGLVPVATAVAAVPEFLGEEEGFLAEPEDHRGLAAAIAALHHDPDGFLRRSAAAAARVRRQAGVEVVVPQEIALIRGDR